MLARYYETPATWTKPRRWRLAPRARGPAIRHHALRALIAARRGHCALAMQIADTLATMDGRYAFGGPAYWRARIAGCWGPGMRRWRYCESPSPGT